MAWGCGISAPLPPSTGTFSVSSSEQRCRIKHVDIRKVAGEIISSVSVQKPNSRAFRVCENKGNCFGKTGIAFQKCPFCNSRSAVALRFFALSKLGLRFSPNLYFEGPLELRGVEFASFDSSRTKIDKFVFRRKKEEKKKSLKRVTPPTTTFSAYDSERE